ncbi:MAG: hypothetical protein AB1817_00585 [Chloroflexota bacterium]
MKHATALAILALVLIGCVTSPTPIPPTQTPWVITATFVAPAPTPRVVPATPIVSAPTSAPTNVSSGTETISWSDAGNFVNQSKTVCGPVVRTTFAQTTNGQPTYLDLGRAYPDPARFSVLIWGNQRANFPSAPETLYHGKTICVTGKIASYRGTLEMEVRTPSQIEVK